MSSRSILCPRILSPSFRRTIAKRLMWSACREKICSTPASRFITRHDPQFLPTNTYFSRPNRPPRQRLIRINHPSPLSTLSCLRLHEVLLGTTFSRMNENNDRTSFASTIPNCCRPIQWKFTRDILKSDIMTHPNTHHVVSTSRRYYIFPRSIVSKYMFSPYSLCLHSVALRQLPPPF